MDSPHWSQAAPEVLVHRDSCNVYALTGGDGRWLIVNAGTGRAADHLSELPDMRNVQVLLTHHFRDHVAGAVRFRRLGASILAPYWERDHLTERQPATSRQEHALQYELAWDDFAPIEPVVIDRWLMDYEQTTVAGLSVQIVPAPAASLGASVYVVTTAKGRRVAFIGELMSSPGRMARLSPLQYHYNDLIGGENVLLSWRRVVASGADLACPSQGKPFGDLAAASARMQRNLRRFDSIQPGYAAKVDALPEDQVDEVCPRLYRAHQSLAETHFIVGRSGRVLALDYGYATGAMRYPQRAAPWTRRTLLHSVEPLKRVGGDGSIDVVLATHYHDDHIGSVSLLQRLFSTQLWAGENFADLVERPDAYDRPCLWPNGIPVARRLPLGQTVHWEDVAITAHPMVGHTEFSTLLCLEFDGRRIAHTGDQFFFQNEAGANVPPAAASGVFTNHVYKNGLQLGGYGECVRRLREFQPDLILSGHCRPYRLDEKAWRMLDQAADAFDEVHRELMALEEGDIHFGPESRPATLQPACLHLDAKVSVRCEISGWVLNPFGRTAVAELKFVTLVAGWWVRSLQLALGPREKKTFITELVVTSEAQWRRPVALDLVVDGQPFGQVATMRVTVEGSAI